ncbi:MAG: GNAT family N-acetyltransferase [Bacteroidota bacterium]
MTLFGTNRLQVRRFTGADSDAFFEINGSQQVMKYIRPPKSRVDSDAFLQENLNLYQEGSCLGRFAVIEKGSLRIAGTFSFLYLSGEADFHIGYALLPWAWGKGYATELVEEGIAFFFRNTQHPQLFAITVPGNAASQRVLEKTGFQYKEARPERGETLSLFVIGRTQTDPAHIAGK